MTTRSSDTPRPLPPKPNLRHLKDQARDLLKAGKASSLSDAQFKVAAEYGFASWPKLKSHVDSLEEIGELKLAIDNNDFDRLKTMVTRNPALHRAPLGYGSNGPLTWIAECRVPRQPPGAARLAMAKWMIDNGSGIHQGGDGPLMRAALADERIAMMQLLVENGADVNAVWGGHFPIIFAPCETLAPKSLQWLLDHGANPNCPDPARKYSCSALDSVIETYARSPQLAECIDILLKAGGKTRYDAPAALDLLRNRLDLLSRHLDEDPSLLHRRFGQLDFGMTGARRLTLKGTTLLHVAAEYGNVQAARLLLDRGADVNARAQLDESGTGGQTAIFHAVTQFADWGLPVAKLLIERGADLSLRAKLPGHYEKEGEVVECTPLEYAKLFPGGEGSKRAVDLLTRECSENMTH